MPVLAFDIRPPLRRRGICREAITYNVFNLSKCQGELAQGLPHKVVAERIIFGHRFPHQLQ